MLKDSLIEEMYVEMDIRMEERGGQEKATFVRAKTFRINLTFLAT